VGWLERLRGSPGSGERTTGRPTSSNGASSLHLWWRWAGPPPELIEVAVDLEVVVRPSVDDLHFWALQVGFADSRPPRPSFGAGHVGLQHHPAHPGGTAVNWGGYGPDGRELGGTVSPLASATGNPNTRDLVWLPGRSVRLEVRRGLEGWAALVDGLPVRDLRAGGDRLVGVGMWSEVFAPCDAPTSVVRWSGMQATTVDGRVVRPAAVVTGYQSVRDGGCSNSSSQLDPSGGVLQMTNVARTVPPGAVLPLGAPADGGPSA
jgi:hypothetical protein